MTSWIGILAMVVVGFTSGVAGTSLARWSSSGSAGVGTISSGAFDLSVGTQGQFQVWDGTTVVASGLDADPVCGADTSMTYSETLSVSINGSDDQVSNMKALLAVFGTSQDFPDIAEANALKAELFDPEDESVGIIDGALISETPQTVIPEDYAGVWTLQGKAGEYRLVWTWTLACDPWNMDNAQVELPERSFLLEQVR
jgi:alternate signal-mediated exported protein